MFVSIMVSNIVVNMVGAVSAKGPLTSPGDVHIPPGGSTPYWPASWQLSVPCSSATRCHPYPPLQTSPADCANNHSHCVVIHSDITI